MRLCAFVFGGRGGFRPRREGGTEGRLFQSTGSGEVRSFRARREGRAHQSYDLPQKLSKIDAVSLFHHAHRPETPKLGRAFFTRSDPRNLTVSERAKNEKS